MPSELPAHALQSPLASDCGGNGAAETYSIPQQSKAKQCNYNNEKFNNNKRKKAEQEEENLKLNKI